MYSLTRLTRKFPDGEIFYNGHNTVSDLVKKLWEYEEIGYTPEELQLCFNPPTVLYIISDVPDSTEKKIQEIYPIDGEQTKITEGKVSWNCKNDLGNKTKIPLSGLHENYFLTCDEAGENI